MDWQIVDRYAAEVELWSSLTINFVVFVTGAQVAIGWVGKRAITVGVLESAALNTVTMGLAILVLTAYSATGPQVLACGALPQSNSPITAFEFARSVADLHAIFGDGPSSCRAAITARISVSASLDMFLFSPIECAFLVFFFWSIRERNRRLALAGIAVTLAVIVLGYVENVALVALSMTPDSFSAWLSLLPWLNSAKWIGFAIIGVIGGLMLARGRSVINLIAAGLCFMGLVTTVLAVISPEKFAILAPDGVGLSWLVFLIVGIRELLERARRRSSVSPPLQNIPSG